MSSVSVYLDHGRPLTSGKHAALCITCRQCSAQLPMKLRYAAFTSHIYLRTPKSSKVIYPLV